MLMLAALPDNLAQRQLASLNTVGTCGTRSRPFSVPKSGKIAVKVINHYGDGVLEVFEVES